MTFHLNGHCYQLSGHWIWWASYFAAWYGANRQRALLSLHMHSGWLRLGIILVLLGYRIAIRGNAVNWVSSVARKKKWLNEKNHWIALKAFRYQGHLKSSFIEAVNPGFAFMSFLCLLWLTFMFVPLMRYLVNDVSSTAVQRKTRYCQTVLSLESKTDEKTAPRRSSCCQLRVYICRQNRLWYNPTQNGCNFPA